MTQSLGKRSIKDSHRGLWHLWLVKAYSSLSEQLLMVLSRGLEKLLLDADYRASATLTDLRWNTLRHTTTPVRE